MRWFVEISPLGPQSELIATFCVEAPQWQPALQKARHLRGDGDSLTGFSIELLEDGFRAIDPVKRLRYLIKRAPDDTPLTREKPAAAKPAAAKPTAAKPAAAKPAAAKPAAKKAPAEAEDFKKRPLMQTMAFGSQGDAVVEEALAAARAVIAAKAAEAKPAETKPAEAKLSPAPEPEPEPEPEPILLAKPIAKSDDKQHEEKPAAEALPSFEVVSERNEDPTESSPLTYREHVYAVAAGTSEDDARRLIFDRFEQIKSSLSGARRGRFINLAIFDHTFEGKPLRRPLVTLSWKDWKNLPPELRYPYREASVPPPATRSAPPPGFLASPSSPPAAPKPASKPAPKPAPKAGKRLSGDELITELFEACGDLHFLRDALEGADFVLSLALEKIPCEIGLVSLFDINKREYVVVRQAGGQRSALCHRLRENAAVAQRAMRSHRALVLTDRSELKRVADPRWTTIGVELKNLICSPVELGGRTLGLIEIANPLDGKAFTEGDGNALTYIGQQFAEFVASRGVITAAEQILKSTPSGA